MFQFGRTLWEEQEGVSTERCGLGRLVDSSSPYFKLALVLLTSVRPAVRFGPLCAEARHVRRIGVGGVTFGIRLSGSES